MDKRKIPRALTAGILVISFYHAQTMPPPLTSDHVPITLLFEQEACEELAKLYEEKRIEKWGPFPPTSTLLNKALVKAYRDFARELIEQGAPLDNKTSNLMTPLAYAIIRGYLDLVALLLAKGVPSDRKENEQTPFQLAANYGQADIIKLIAQHGGIADPMTPWGKAIHLAAASGHLPIVEYLLDKLKYNIDLQDSQGQTALHHAVKAGQFEMVIYLLKRGSNSALKDKQGNLALALAFNEQLETDRIEQLVQALIAAGSPADSSVKKALDACLKRLSKAPEEERIIKKLEKTMNL